jgi:DUF1680 family protein
MYTPMADLAAYTGDESLFAACRRLWDNIVHKQMYITGGIGSTHHGEAFTFDYDLPNDTVYAETCASIGLIFFASRMLRLEARSEYADVLERALYNTVIAGMARDGRHFFYVNPLEVWPKASRGNPGKHHIKPVRPGWFSCACCPPNVARLLSSLGEYLFTVKEKTLYVHLYMGGEGEVELDGGLTAQLRMASSLPWQGKVSLEVTPASAASFTLALRLPAWCSAPQATVNGEAIDVRACMRDGYAYVGRVWSPGDRVELDLPMLPQLVRSHPQLRANAGRVAIQRGPLVYALEEADNGGSPLSSLVIRKDAPMEVRFDAAMLGGAVVIEGQAMLEEESGWIGGLYSPSEKKVVPVSFKAIPYYLWGNRGEGEMAVWLRE